MHMLPLTSVPRWIQLESDDSIPIDIWFPASIDTNCPYCRRNANFRLVKLQYDANRNAVASSARCPGCIKEVSFWVIKPALIDESKNGKCECLAMFPGLSFQRQPLLSINLVPDHIARAYQDAIRVYNAEVWSATATCCRRTLEGIVKDLVKPQNENTSLASQLSKLKDSVDLNQPLITLAHAIREGGNIGAHLDLRRDADKDTAEAILDLTEYLLEYIFALPAMIDKLNHRVAALENQSKK